MAAFGGHESCPNCGARMATDQRYCLNCGHRRGEPRLPFMDAVVFMESMSAPGGTAGPPPPPPPAEQPSPNKWNANAALIAGVATLVLAIGVGFLIGRSGHNESGSAGGGEVKVVQVGGAAAPSETPETAPEEESTKNSGNSGGAKGKEKSSGKAPAKKKASEVKEGSKEEVERAEEKTQQVLHAKGPQAKTGAQVGEKCVKGTPGCEGEEFTGNFFGE